MRVTINENVVFNDDIETGVYYRIMGNCDTLMNDITRYNQDNLWKSKLYFCHCEIVNYTRHILIHYMVSYVN